MRRLRVVLSIVAVAIVLSSSFSSLEVSSGDDVPTRGDGANEDAEWPQFRGNLNNTGFSSSSVPETNDKYLSFSTLSPIWSSPSYVDGVVYFGSQSNLIYAVDTVARKELWKYPTGGLVDSTPMIHDDTLYVGSSDSNLYALNATTGDLLWPFPTGSEIVSSPKYHNGSVFFGSKDWNFYAVNVSDQSHRWGTPFQTGGEIWGAPAIADGRVFFGSNDGNFYSLWIENGTVDWTFSIGSVTNGSVRFSSAAVYKGRVIVGSDDYNVYCLDEFTGEEIWNFTTGDYVYSSPAVHNDTVYVGSNDFYFYAIPLDDPNTDGVIDQTEILWSVYTEDFEGGSSPAVADGKVLVGSTSFGLMCLDEKNGSHIWNFTISAGAVSSPAVVDGKIFIGGKNGVMYGLGSPDLGHVLQFTTTPDVVSPTVTSSSPNGNNVSIGSIVKATFSEPMDRTSTEGAFSISPTIDGALAWSGTTLLFMPAYPLSIGTQYTVSIGTGSTDLSGNPLESTYMWQFTTSSIPDIIPPIVENNSPTGFNVSLSATVSVTFSEPMNRTNVEAAFSALPAITGVISWSDNVMAYMPTSPLWYGMTYTITVNVGATDAVGNPLESAYSWQFSTTSEPDTTPPTVKESSPTGGSITTGTIISVTFSEPMDRSSAEEAFVTSPGVDGVFDWVDNTMIFTPTSPLLPETEYIVIIRTTATDLAGNNLFSPSLEVEIIPDSDSIKSNRVMGITFRVTYDQMPVEGAFVNLDVSLGELSQLGASTFSDGTNRVKYTAPSVQVNTTVTITAEAGKFGFQGGSATYDIIIEPGTGYGNIASESEFPWHKYLGYIVVLVVLTALNLILVVMLIKRRRVEKLEEST